MVNLMNISAQARPQQRYGIVGGAAVPHAPQLLSAPKTESPEQIARVRQAMHSIGEALRELEPDLIIVISNEHGNQFILDSVPAFTFHCGDRAQGQEQHHGSWAMDGEAGYAVVRALQEEGFDPAFSLSAEIGTSFTIPFEFMGWDRETPMLALFVNAYVPPQPPPERCFEFGKALNRVLARLGRRAVLIASGGLSHYPGTARYADPGPDLEFDKAVFEAMSQGNLRRLLAFDAADLDRSGNVEARSWLMLAGALGEAKPDQAVFEENWHHTYAMLGWTTRSTAQERERTLWYPQTPPHRIELSRALHTLRTDTKACERFIGDPDSFIRGFQLGPDEIDPLKKLDEPVLRDALGVHPLLVAGALRRIHITRQQSDA